MTAKEIESLIRRSDILTIENDELRKRIEKAIQWLGDYEDMASYFECSKREMKELYDILKGEE